MLHFETLLPHRLIDINCSIFLNVSEKAEVLTEFQYVLENKYSKGLHKSLNIFFLHRKL